MQALIVGQQDPLQGALNLSLRDHLSETREDQGAPPEPKIGVRAQLKKGAAEI